MFSLSLISFFKFYHVIFSLLSSGAIYSESSRERESAGSATKDTDVVGSLLFLGGQDSPHHTGGQAKNGQTLDNKVQPQKIHPGVVGKIQGQTFKSKSRLTI